MSAFENNPWIKMDKKQANKFENNPWVQKDKELASGAKDEDSKNLKNPRKVPESSGKTQPEDEQPSGWKEPAPKKVGQNPFGKAKEETTTKLEDEIKKPEKKAVTNPFGLDKQEEKKTEVQGWKEPAQKKIGTNPFEQKDEPKEPPKEAPKNPRKAPANPFGSQEDKPKDPVVKNKFGCSKVVGCQKSSKKRIGFK